MTTTAAHPLSAEDLDKLQELERAATLGPWDIETVRSEGEYGSDEDGGQGFDAYAVVDSKGRPMLDSLNRDDSSIHTDTDGDMFYAWDELAKRDAQFIAAARNAMPALIAQARAALTGQATAPAQAGPSEQDERGHAFLCSLLPADFMWGDSLQEITLDEILDRYDIAVRAAQGVSGAQGEPVACDACTGKGYINNGGYIARCRVCRPDAALPAPSVAPAQGEPTGATGAAGGEERAGYCADCNSWGGEHGEGCQRRPERFSRAAASQAAPGVGVEPIAGAAAGNAASLDLADLDNTAKEALRNLSHVENHLEQSEAPKTIQNRAVDVRLCIKELRAALRKVSALPAPAQPAGAAPELTVWYGPMPESNGRHNYTAVLHRADAEGFDIFTDGFQFARSEYPDRVRHEADFMLWLIGQRAERPELWDACYDMDKHSGYAAAHAPVVRADVPADLRHVLEMARQDLTMNRTLKARDRVVEALAMLAASPSPSAPQPIPMILHCPACRVQHVDGPDERTPGWKNKPHRSHLCHACGHIWRPADVPTVGVAAIETRGKNDSPSAPQGQDSTPAAKVIINDGKGTATIMLAPEARLPVGSSLYAAPVAGEAPDCPHCDGKGEYTHKGQDTKCRVCGGSGHDSANGGEGSGNV